MSKKSKEQKAVCQDKLNALLSKIHYTVKELYDYIAAYKDHIDAQVILSVNQARLDREALINISVVLKANMENVKLVETFSCQAASIINRVGGNN